MSGVYYKSCDECKRLIAINPYANFGLYEDQTSQIDGRTVCWQCADKLVKSRGLVPCNNRLQSRRGRSEMKQQAREAPSNGYYALCDKCGARFPRGVSSPYVGECECGENVYVERALPCETSAGAERKISE
jgi:hypothetical protein